MKKPIQNFSVGYNLLRAYTAFYLRLYYKKTTIIGLENIPKNTPVILAINHQNALMDALIALCWLKQQPVFMARSDIFKSKTAANILRWMKILPIYRIRDGVKSLQNNEAIFEEAVGVLQDKKILGILPEGNHFGHRRLRVLKKGIARIAFKAEERNDFTLGIKIIPVGLDYTNYTNFGSKMLVNIGKPFDLAIFKDQYLENDQKGMNAFMQELRAKMLPQMLNINDSENYDAIKATLDYYIINYEKNNRVKLDHVSRIEKLQETSDKLIELKESSIDKFNELTSKALEMDVLIEKLKFRKWVVSKESYNFIGILAVRLLQILLLPFFVAGFITNIIPFQIPVKLSRGVKDEQFLSSFRFVLGLIVFTVMYLIYLILLLIFISKWYYAIAVAIAIPILGLISFKYYVWFKRTSAKFRFNSLIRKNNTDMVKLKENWKYIAEYFNN